jgi:hypothetical protein
MTMNQEFPSKDQFFERIGALADAMIEAYGKDFAMGALILSARFVAESKPAEHSAVKLNTSTC